MKKLSTSLGVWGSDAFAPTLKTEVEGLPPGALPLAEGTLRGGQVDDSDLAVTVIDFSEDAGWIRARVGVFFNEVVGGCSCGDEPEPETAYCELLVSIDRATAEAEFSVIAE
jgi:hypothetical protein